MLWKTYHKLPVVIDFSTEEGFEIAGKVMREYYRDCYDMLEDDVRADLSRLYQHFTGKPIDYLERLCQ